MEENGALPMLDATCDDLALLARLADNMRDLAFCESGACRPREMDWAAQVRALAQIMVPYAQREGTTLRVEGGRGVWVRGDMALAERVVIWLVASLVRTGIGKGEIVLALKAGEETACLIIRDSRPCVGLGRAILGEGALNALNAEKRAGSYLAWTFCRSMGWTIETLAEGGSAGFRLSAPLALQEGAQLCSRDETPFEAYCQRRRVNREMGLLLGKL